MLLPAAMKLYANTETLTAGREPPERRFVFRFGAPQVFETDAGAEVVLEGCEADGAPGWPLLPVRGVTLAIPAGYQPGEVRLHARGTTARVLAQPVACAQEAVPLSADAKRAVRTRRDPTAYARRTPYPAFEDGEGLRLRVDRRHGVDELTLTLHPVQVVPAENRLLCHAEIIVEVSWQPALPQPRDALRPRLPRKPQHVSASGDAEGVPDILDSGDEAVGMTGGASPLHAGRYDHLIIAPQALVTNTPAPWNLDALAAARRDAGLASTVVATEWIYANYAGRDNAERLRAFIRDAYQEWSARFVLLVGTAQLVPTRNLFCAFSTYTAMIPSDSLYYGCLDGDFDFDGDNVFGEIGDGVGGGDVDLVAEVQVGRFPVADAAELSRMVRKTLAYEAAAASRLTRAVKVGEHLGFGGDAEYATGAMEQLRLGATDAGFTSIGFENPAYGSHFDTGTTLYDAPGTSWPKADMLALLNQDIHVVNHLGHGAPRVCFKLNVSLTADRQAIAGLTNSLPYLAYSQACESGRFDDYADCFAEQFVTASAGAFAAVMNTRFGWGYLGRTDGPSQRFHRKFWDGIFGEQVYHLGSANARAKESLRHLVDPRAGNVFRWCYYEITLFGDPATPFAARVLRQPPAFDHSGLQNQLGGMSAYGIEVGMGPVSLYDSASPRLLWHTSAVPGAVHTNLLTRGDASRYTAQIPAQPLGATVHYALHAETLAGVAGRWPAEGEQTFMITEPLTLEIRGEPVAWGSVEPAYGLYTVASGVTVRARAPARVVEPGGVSRALQGCAGTGSVASSALAEFDVTVVEPSTLTWLWQTEYALQHTSNVPGLLTSVAWFTPDVVTTSAVAPETALWLSQTYCFAGWYLDGRRQPDAPGMALMQVPLIAMTTSHVATAYYLPDWQDGDLNGVPDWWEYRFFGAAGWPADADDDGDGFDTAQEYADRTNPFDPNSYPRPPDILHVPLAASQGAPPPYTVRATITDSYRVEKALLVWQVNGGPWQTNTLARGAGDAFSATIMAPGAPRDLFVYQIVASDPAGYEAVHGPHALTLVYPQIALAPAGGHQAVLPSGGEAESALTVTNAGNAALVWSLAHGVCESVGADPGLWTTNALGQPWRVTAARAASAPYAFHAQPISGGTYYSPPVRAGLLSPPLYPATGARLAFKHWIDTELDARQAGWAFDGGMVEISTDGGVTFQQLDGPYTHRIAGWAYSPWPDGTPCFAGDGSVGWQEVSFALDAFAGQAVRVRFHVGGDNNTDRGGWYVDDIRVGPVADPAWPAWAACGATAGMVIPGRGIAIPVYVMAVNALRRDERVPIHILSNDPVRPNVYTDWTLKIRDVPWLDAVAAVQTSTQGEGIVTLAAAVAEADGEPVQLDIAFSCDGGGSWAAPELCDAQSTFGLCVLNAAASRVEQVVTAVSGTPVTNTVSALWDTWATQPPLPLLVPDMRMRVRAVSPYFASPAVMTAPFMVDNEAPAEPSLAVTTHAVGRWSRSAAMRAQWAPVSDGAGVGGVTYRRRLSQTADDALAGAGSTADVAEAITAPDGSNLWFAVQSVDAAGNASAIVRLGPYRVDTAPPESAGAFVRVRRSAYGPYAVGPNLTVEWGGFSDALSGIDGYYLLQHAGGMLALPTFSAATSGSLAAVSLGVTNQFTLYAVDRVGNTSVQVRDAVWVLDPDVDSDGDGHSAADEELAGSDATDPESVLRLGLAGVQTTGSTSALEVVWNSLPGRRYTVLATPSLALPDWRPVTGMTDVPGVGAVVTNTVTVGGPAFLRLSVAAEPEP